MKTWIILLFLFVTFEEGVAEKLYVFIPSVNSPKTIQQNLKNNMSAEVVTFSKLDDFLKKVEADRPEGVITRNQVLTKISGYDVKAKGVYKGNTDQIFFAVGSKGATLKANSTIGIVDFLGGKEMKMFATDISGVGVKVKSVKKFKDLLPLLTMNLAEAAIVAESEVDELQKTSSQYLQAIKLPGIAKDFTVFAGTGDSKIVEDVRKLTTEINLILGVESWE